MLNEDKRKTHPGYAVKFENGSWLTSAHGLYLDEDAFMGITFKTREEAESLVTEAQKEGEIPSLKFEVVEAWQPVCERLRHDIEMLNKANTISPSDLMNIRIELENIMSRLDIYK